MKISNITKALAAVLFAGVVSASASSISITSTGFNGSPYAGGGEYLAVTSDNGTFVTFCLEKDIGISTGLGHGYTYTIDGTIQVQDDALSIGTTYLYGLFLTNSLPGYLSNHDYNAGLLQKALWTLEDESIAYDASNPYLQLAITKFGTLSSAKVDSNSKSVKALNVWGPRESDRQSLIINVPDSSVTVGMLGLALLGLAAIRRKF